MSFQELLKACSSGKLPSVQHKDHGIGVVTVIKDGYHHKGCAVRFPHVNYDLWFHSADGTDKRSKYMNELNLVP